MWTAKCNSWRKMQHQHETQQLLTIHACNKILTQNVQLFDSKCNWRCGRLSSQKLSGQKWNYKASLKLTVSSSLNCRYTVSFTLSQHYKNYNPSEKSPDTFRRNSFRASPVSVLLQWSCLFFQYSLEPAKKRWGGEMGENRLCHCNWNWRSRTGPIQDMGLSLVAF